VGHRAGLGTVVKRKIPGAHKNSFRFLSKAILKTD